MCIFTASAYSSILILFNSDLCNCTFSFTEYLTNKTKNKLSAMRILQKFCSFCYKVLLLTPSILSLLKQTVAFNNQRHLLTFGTNHHVRSQMKQKENNNTDSVVEYKSYPVDVVVVFFYFVLGFQWKKNANHHFLFTSGLGFKLCEY